MGASNLWSVGGDATAEPFPKCLCKDDRPIDKSLSESKKAAPFPRCPWAVDLNDKRFPGRGISSPRGASRA